MTDMIDADDRIAAFSDQLGDSKAVAAQFSSELDRMRDAMAAADRDGANLSRTFGTGVRRAIDGVVRDGRSLSDALRGIGRSFSNAAYRSAAGPVTEAAGGALSRLPLFEALSGGAAGLASARPRGDAASGGPAPTGSPAVTINVTTPDVAGFHRSRSQIAAEMSRMLARGRRNA